MEKKPVIHTSKLIVIGGSSGSLDALLVILPILKKEFNIPIVIVVHRSNQSDSGLAELLSTRTTLQIKEADEKDVLEPGWIYIAPADYHLLVEDDETLSLDLSEKVNYCRPSIDVSFISAAAAYKKRLTAVLLSGANADGAAGIKTVKECGGFTIVQHPDESPVSYMPEQAILLSPVDKILKSVDIAAALNNI
jgi:two-component system chemotaxis response regulator CheB